MHLLFYRSVTHRTFILNEHHNGLHDRTYRSVALKHADSYDFKLNLYTTQCNKQAKRNIISMVLKSAGNALTKNCQFVVVKQKQYSRDVSTSYLNIFQVFFGHRHHLIPSFTQSTLFLVRSYWCHPLSPHFLSWYHHNLFLSLHRNNVISAQIYPTVA